MTVHEFYDPASDSWHAAAPLPRGRSSVAGAALAGAFLVIGGEDGGESRVYDEVGAYDPETDTRTALTSLPLPVQGIGAAVTDGAGVRPGRRSHRRRSGQSTVLLIVSVRG